MTDVATPIVRVLVVDADRRVRAALASLIGLASGLAVVGSTGRADEALGQLESDHPDAVVLDPRLPDVDDGLDLIALIRSRRPDIGIVVLTWDDAVGSRSLAAGADRYVPKTIEPEELIGTIEALLGGRDPAGSGEVGLK